MSRLQQYYRDTVVKNLMATGAYKNVMDVPRITKITLNMGLGEAIGDKKVLESALGDMEKITGQKPVTTLARKSVASFKVRDGYPIGCKVTLRREQMYEFLDRLISISIPNHLMVAAISTWVSKSRSSFLRSNTRRSMRSAVWISVLRQLLVTTKVVWHC